jgi:hypothetical protein
LDRNSVGLSGPQVVQALKVVSDQIYHAGIDDAYVRIKGKRGPNIADAWDLTWVTALSINLWDLQSQRRKKNDQLLQSGHSTERARTEKRRQHSTPVRKANGAGLDARARALKSAFILPLPSRRSR